MLNSNIIQKFAARSSPDSTVVILLTETTFDAFDCTLSMLCEVTACKQCSKQCPCHAFKVSERFCETVL